MSALAQSSDVDVGAVVLDVVDRKLTKGAVNVADRLTGGTLETTMEGASTLTLVADDHDRTLLRSGLLATVIDVQVDAVWWRLVQVAKSGDAMTLTFEDRVIAYLREHTSPRKASRAKMTRAEFALSLVREVHEGGGIPFVCPQLDVKQKVAPIATSSDAVTPAARTASVGQGIPAGTPLTIGGASATATQISNCERVLDCAASVNAGPRATLAVMEACIVESRCQNLNYGDADSLGILQVRSSTAGPMGIDNRDIEACVNAFLTRGFTGKGSAIVLAASNPSWTPGQVAQAVQGSAYPGRYDQAQTEAQQVINAYQGPAAGTSTTTSITTALPYQFQRGGTDGTTEDSWTCLQRLASEVQWRCFVVAGTCYFVSDTTLMQAKPWQRISEDTLGVDGIDFEVDNGKATSEATVTARADRWAVPPGAVIELFDCGPGNGRWLVDDVSRGIFDPEATILLKRPTQPLLEPAPQTTTTSQGASASTVAGTFGSTELLDSDPVAQAWQAANAIGAKRYPYVWGGGHAHCGTPDGGVAGGPGGGEGLVGFDCSGGVCAILAAGAMGFTPGGPATVSGTLENWGDPGQGQYLTIYASAVHTFSIFHTANGDVHCGTGNWGSDWGGFGPKPELHPTDGFTARHWPGT